jgi:hypothetical protein
MIARKLVLGCLLLLVGLYALCGAGIFLLRWIDPWTTTVQIERRVQALAHIVPIQNATNLFRFRAFRPTCSMP